MIKLERGINTKPSVKRRPRHPLRPTSDVLFIRTVLMNDVLMMFWEHHKAVLIQLQIPLIIISTLFQSCLFLTSMPWCAYCFIQHCLTLPLIQLWLCLNWQICSLGLCFLLHLCCWLWSVSCHIALHLGQACSIPTQSCLCVCVFACVFNHVGRVCLSVAACNPAWSYRHVSFWQILPENSPHPGKNPVGQFPTDIFSGSIPSPGKFPRKSPEWRVTAHTIVVILLCCSHLLAS